METNKGEIVLYNPNETIRIEVRLDNETVWLTQSQMGVLFGRDRSVIGKHINNIFSEGELVREVVCANYAHTTLHGAIKDKTQQREVVYYNLDVIISVGYRVKSKQGTLFRQWANKVLKEFLLRGYVVNHQISEIREELQQHAFQIYGLQEKVDGIIHSALPPQEGIFFNGQIFDAYVFVCNLIKRAKRRIILIDNYVDESVLLLFSKRAENVSATIYTQKISEQFRLDIQKHNNQYPQVDVKICNQSHDRFLIIDDELYLVGASLKDLGKKWFGFSKMESFSADTIIARLECI